MDSQIYIGLMSGTSVDGLDICAASFDGKIYSIIEAETCKYSIDLQYKLLNSHLLSSIDLAQLNVDFGIFCGCEVKKFVAKHKLNAKYVSSHGHTVFHTPQTGLTLQIGSGAHIAAQSGLSTISDFRILDVAMGGQGAPLVPIGDELLFSEYDYCLNIGGFANVSTLYNDANRVAWDICPANIVLNSFAKKYNQSFDENGNIGRKGIVDEQLLKELNSLKYYEQSFPKSLGREWVETNVNPIFNKYKIDDSSKMRTYYEHCAYQIGKTLKNANTKTLCTGGGVHNSFLMERISQYSNSQLIIPDNKIIDYKEALIFAYLGFLRVQEQSNCIASVTGAKKNVCGGVVWIV